MNDQSSSQSLSTHTTKKITVARDINTGQGVILVDLPPGMHLEVLATHELQPHESYRSFYKQIVASNIFKRPNPNESSSSSSSGNNATGTPDSAPSPSPSTDSSSRGTKRKSKSNSNSEAQREIKRRKRRSYADIPPSTRVLRST